MSKNYIKKIKKSDIEDYLGIQIEPNKISIGWDVAMHATGIAIIRTTDTYLILDQVHKITVPKNVDLLDGIDLFIAQLEDFKQKVAQKYKVDVNIIEDCWMGQNVTTLKVLARFSILVYDRFKNITTKSQLVLPTSARSKIKFKKSNEGIKGTKLKKEILKYVNFLLETKIEDYDVADAAVLALGGVINV